MTTSVFLFGPLQDTGLQQVVFGHALTGADAVMSGAVLAWDGSWRGPWMINGSGEIDGTVVALDAEEIARLSYYAAALGMTQTSADVASKDGIERCQMLAAGAGMAPQGWDFATWQGQWQSLVLLGTTDLMMSYGDVRLADAKLVMSQIMVRAASTHRAEAALSPMGLRHGFASGDVVVEQSERPYLDFFQIDEQHLTFKRFDGRQSEVVKRAAFVSGDAVTVLPYDPVRDRVLLIEQFRFAPFVRGDQHPWSVEVIAGRIDAGESPEQAARREAVEETGLVLSVLEPVANYYPSPGAVTEYLYSYVGLADLPDDVARIKGLASEAEDIRGILLSFEELMQFMASGEAENGPLLLSVYWLAANRERLRASA